MIFSHVLFQSEHLAASRSPFQHPATPYASPASASCSPASPSSCPLAPRDPVVEPALEPAIRGFTLQASQCQAVESPGWASEYLKSHHMSPRSPCNSPIQPLAFTSEEALQHHIRVAS